MTVQQRALLRAAWFGLTVGFGAIFLRFELAHADSSTVYTTFGRPVVAAMRGFTVAMLATALLYWIGPRHGNSWRHSHQKRVL